MTEMDPRLHLGTSSFSTTDWIGPFYPLGSKPADFLQFYATKLGSVEIDSTYYRAPSLQMTQRWAAVTPPDFRFSLKVPKSITHDKALTAVEEEWAGLLRSVDPLGKKLVYLVLQFPYWNRKSAIPDQATFIKRLEAFVALGKCPYRLVVETRNPKWITKELLDFLRAHNLIFALQDQQWMGRPGELWDKWGMELKTGDSIYIRMLGERERIEKILAERKAEEEKGGRQMTPEWSRIVIDRTEETREWLPMVRKFLAHSVEVDIYYNNHYAGHGPASIELFLRLFAATA
jgi:uncharacterized protein YecE (DUF72 family)